MLLADRMDGIKTSEIRDLLKVLERPDVISFAGGIPDPSLFPKDKFQAAITRILNGNDGAQSLQYSISEGYLPLREWLVQQMENEGVPCGVDNILITSGSQQALDLIGKLYLSKNDNIYVKKPTYLGALQAFGAYEPKFQELDLVQTDYTANSSNQKAKFAYVCSDFANPDGLSLTLAERTSILRMMDDQNMPLVEDGAYRSLRYTGQSLPSILALELEKVGDINQSKVIYFGSFSKTLSPGMRVGWVCASKHIIEKLVLLKQAVDLHSPTLGQMAVHQVVQDGFDVHVDRLKHAYGQKMNVMLEALSENMPDSVSWNEPEGGMFVWLSLPEHLDAKLALQKAIDEFGVAYVPGSAFYFDSNFACNGTHTLRLNFSHPSEPDIKAGVEKLSTMFRQVI